MADFESSFHRGISAAKDAARNRAEVKAVLAEVDAQLDRASDGKLHVAVEERLAPPANLLASALVSFGVSQEKYLAIVARNKVYEQAGARELARWRVDPSGYPCWIKTAELDLACENKEALEQGLATLLSTPTVGEAMYALLNFAPPDQADASA
ncbi:MAG TPA: hypothetical protein VF447_04235 [Terriglobales bacterium]